MDYVKLDPSVVHIDGKPFPLMFNYYTSFLRTYLTLPLFALFGIDVITVRLSSILFGTVGLMFFAAFARRLTGSSGLALTAGLFLALDPSFVGYTHNDYVAVSTMMAWKGIALWTLIRWWRGERAQWLAAGMFFVGLGVTDRASFLWIPISLAAAFLLIERKDAWKKFKGLWPGTSGAILCISSGILGASIFLAFNIATMGGSFVPMAETFRQTSGGVDNTDFLATLYMRMQMLTDVLGGGYLLHFLQGENSYQTMAWHFSGSPLSWLVPLSFAFYFVRSVRGLISGASVHRVALFLTSMTACVLVLTCFTPTIHRGHQLLMLYPFPHILVAMFLHEMLLWISHFGKLRRVSVSVGLIVLGLLSLWQGERVVAYHAMLRESGGRGVWSDAISSIVAEADRQPDKTYVCMDWGFNANILSLTKNRVQTIRSYGTARRSPEELVTLFTERHRFLVHAEESEYLAGGGVLLRDAAGKVEARIDTLITFTHRAGDPVAHMLRIVR
jgi:hypothetical protein